MGSGWESSESALIMSPLNVCYVYKCALLFVWALFHRILSSVMSSSIFLSDFYPRARPNDALNFCLSLSHIHFLGSESNRTSHGVYVWTGKSEKVWLYSGFGFICNVHIYFLCDLLRFECLLLLRLGWWSASFSAERHYKSILNFIKHQVVFPYCSFVVYRQRRMKEDRNWFKPWAVRSDPPSTPPPPCSSSGLPPTRAPKSEQLNYYPQTQECATKRHGSASSK